MNRVASLFLPQLPIERLRAEERSRRPPDALRIIAAALAPPIDDNAGACSVPRGGGWRPGARWARDKAIVAKPNAADIDRLAAHQRPTMREMGRRSEAVGPPFRTLRGDDGASSPSKAPAPLTWSNLWGTPTILIARTGQKDVVTAACLQALELGLHPGMAAAHARALVSGLEVLDAEPEADRAWLDRLALHAVRKWTPMAAVSGPDGLWFDLTGTTHLFGGEARFCRRLLGFLKRLGFSAQIAIAGTPGAAHALARHGGAPIILLPPGHEAEALGPLPLAALRLAPGALLSAARFGLENIGDLYSMPRGPLARRLGLATVERLDQARGMVAEPIIPVIAFEHPRVTRRLLEPIGTPESITQVISDLVDDLVPVLRLRGLGARKITLALDRVDSAVQHIGVGASQATRDAKHLKRMFALKLAEIEPGLGIEAMHLAVPHSEPLGASAVAGLLEDGTQSPDLTLLVDQLIGRSGASALFRLASQESDVPERAVKRVGPLTEPQGWPIWKRPTRLLPRPEILRNVIALLPDHPPRRFTWRRQDYRVIAGDGPERIHGEWWRRPGELWAVRDYFRVEAEGGARFWVFRRGDGIDGPTGDLSWYMHGVFG